MLSKQRHRYLLVEMRERLSWLYFDVCSHRALLLPCPGIVAANQSAPLQSGTRLAVLHRLSLPLAVFLANLRSIKHPCNGFWDPLGADAAGRREVAASIA